MEAINRVRLHYANLKKLETGRRIRIDSTGVDTNIHHPPDSTRLADGIRVITRLLQEGKSLTPIPGYKFADHNRATRKRVGLILNAKRP